jgi:hypothetical protein
MLMIAFSGLFFSMALRGAIDTARFIDEDFEKHVNVNEALYNLLLTIAGDLIPIIFQLSTMIFGYIRNKNEKKNRLEVKDQLGNSENRSTEKELTKSDTSMNSSISGNTSYFDPPLLENTNDRSQGSGSNVGIKLTP